MPKRILMDHDLRAGRKPGKFELKYLNGWAVLTVFPQDETSGIVYAEDVIARMEILGIPGVRKRIIREIIEEAAGEPRNLVQWPGGASLTGEVDVSLSEDEMTAWIELAPPRKGGSDPNIEEITAALRQIGVVAGLRDDNIREALENHRYNRKITAAEGLPVTHGKPPRVKFLFETNRGKPYLEMDFGRINLRELNFVQNVKDEDTLAVIGGPIEPEDGKTVTGEPIPAEPAREAESLQPGANTRFNDEGSMILAEIDGNVFLENGKVHVEPVVHVKNVDYSTGNIDFRGSVIIDGSIADGFSVKAGGNIQIGKYAGKCTIESGKNIICKAGMHGSGLGSIECKGDLYAKYIENSNISCRGNMFVDEAVMHCQVYVSGSLVLKGRKAEIIGGRIIAGKTVWCKELGNIYEAPTQLFIGIAPGEYRDYLDAKGELKKNQDLQGDIDEKIEQIQRHVKSAENPEEKILLAWEQLKNQSDELEQNINALKQKVKKDPLVPDKDSMLLVEGFMHYGVTVNFGKKEFRPPHKGASKTILKPGIKDIQESGYNRQDPPKMPDLSVSTNNADQ